jgi:DNA-binding MarR family transcriptional regulator
MRPTPKAPPALATLDRLLGFRLRRINLHLARQFSVAVADHALRSGEYSALAAIAAAPGLSQSAICKATGLDKSAAVAVIDALLKRDWIVRARAPQDRRRHVLTLSATGEAAFAGLVERTLEIEAPLLSALSGAEREQLFTLLNKLVERVLGADQ